MDTKLSRLIREYSEKQQIWSDVANRIDSFIHFYEGDLEAIQIELEEEVRHLVNASPICDRNSETIRAINHWLKVIADLKE